MRGMTGEGVAEERKALVFAAQGGSLGNLRDPHVSGLECNLDLDLQNSLEVVPSCHVKDCRYRGTCVIAARFYEFLDQESRERQRDLCDRSSHA